ncbi:MAG: histidine triad nucleotide-binding protein [Clostridium sp.]|nr:histidine triad nucleotide-binding protein [Clostridium sp.]
MENCIFCKIANKEIPSNFVYEDENCVAFNDLNPQAPVHILVIPKKHYASLNELDDPKIMSALLEAVKKVTQKLNIKQFRTVLNTGKEAGQEVFHLHFHILSGRPMKWPPG